MPYSKTNVNLLNQTNTNKNKAWFQQDVKKDYHNWHTHPQCNFTSIYYLELKDSNIKTEIMDPKTKEVIKTPSFEEGDFIIFPAYLLHRSPKNKTRKRKTVFSLNLDFLKKDEDI